MPPMGGVGHRHRPAVHVPHRQPNIRDVILFPTMRPEDEAGRRRVRDSVDRPLAARLECRIAWRYLRSRRGSLSLAHQVIAIGGVMVGVSALIVIIGVMTGLQNDLREKILIGSPDIRVLTYGDDW